MTLTSVSNKSIAQGNKVKQYPFEGGEELIVSGSTGATGSDSSPTPSRGYSVSGTGSRSCPEVPVGGGGGTVGYVQASPHYPYSPEDFDKKCSFGYSVRQDGKRKEYNKGFGKAARQNSGRFQGEGCQEGNTLHSLHPAHNSERARTASKVIGLCRGVI